MLTLIGQKLLVTLQLAAMAMLFAMLIGIPMGIIAAVRKGTGVEIGANVAALSGMLISNFWPSIKTMLMPAFVLSTAIAAYLMRHTRSAMLQAP